MSVEVAAARVKEAALVSWLRGRGRVAIGFSGGVVSTYLACVAVDSLGAARIEANRQIPKRPHRVGRVSRGKGYDPFEFPGESADPSRVRNEPYQRPRFHGNGFAYLEYFARRVGEIYVQ